MTDNAVELVFVYGTLKKGQRNHHILETGNAKFIGATVTKEEKFLMHVFESVSSPGKFTPGVFLNGAGKISGELYEVNSKTLCELDRLEGLGEKYDRMSVILSNDMQAWIYIERAGNRSPQNNSGQIEYLDNTYRWK